MSDVVEWSESGLHSVGEDLVMISFLASTALAILFIESFGLNTSFLKSTGLDVPFLSSVDTTTSSAGFSACSANACLLFLSICLLIIIGSALLRTPNAMNGFSELEHFAMSIGPFLGPSLLISCT
nr:unnamed protein product [Callosobruchus chinensis]